jgi:hypothetical protein
MKKRKFTCDCCHETFNCGWTEKEAKQEAEQHGFVNTELSEVCDDCFKKIMKFKNHKIGSCKKQIEEVE